MAGLLVTNLVAAQQRVKYNFNQDWKVIVKDDSLAKNINYDDSKWKKVTLPHAWNEDDAFKKDIVDLSTGIAWYRKHFKIPASSKGQKVFLFRHHLQAWLASTLHDHNFQHPASTVRYASILPGCHCFSPSIHYCNH